MNLRNIDLNLLVFFEALIAERSIAGAARKIGITPSAMSHALHRLRQTFDDRLMERTGHGMVPTSRGLELAALVHAALEQLQSAVDQQLDFDPASSERRFSVRVSPYLADTILPQLCARMAVEAPKTTLVAEFPLANGPASHNSGEIHLRVCANDWGPAFRHQRVLRNRFLVVMRRGHPAAGKEMTLELFLSLKHLFLSSNGPPVFGDMRDRHGRSRKIAVTLPNLASVIPVLQRTDLCALLPESWVKLFCEPGAVVTAPLPIADAAFTVDLIWRLQEENDAGLRWLRRLVVESLSSLYEIWAGPLDRLSDDNPVAADL